ncbi:MAG: hypothetical protein U0525_00060 [Patescibacteria group bacterium]
MQKAFKFPIPTPTPGSNGEISYKPPNGNLVYYNQCDPQYAFGSCGKQNMTCHAGCGPTSVAEIIASYANSAFTPLDAMRIASSLNGVDCAGSGVGTLKTIMSNYSKAQLHMTEDGFNLAGDFNQDAINLKPFIDSGQTILAAASYQPCCGHWIWIVDIDNNYHILANDVYWFQPQYVGSARAPMDLTAFMHGGYPYKGVYSIDVTGYMLVSKK